MELKDIKAIIDLMRKNNLSEFELERQDFKIKLKRAGGGPQPASRGLGLLSACPGACRSGSLAVHRGGARARAGGCGRPLRWKSSRP